jgi:hypothetical protein
MVRARCDSKGVPCLSMGERIAGFDELRPEELAEFGILQGACAAVLSDVLKPAKIYFLVFGESGISVASYMSNSEFFLGLIRNLG